jgi:hypothetical protein
MQKLIEINNDQINGIIYQIKKDFFLKMNNLSFMDENKIKELNFLHRKRENYHPKLRTNNDFSFERGINFTIPNPSKKIGNINQKNESGNDRNYPQYSLINVEANISKKIFDESLDNSNSKENNKSNIITDDKKTNLINKNSISNNSLNKITYFNVTKNINICSDKFSDKCPFDIDNNNEIKVLKNKKAVYINRNLLNSYSISRALKKFKKNKFVIKKKNTSKYRGVSKNGNK